jgi:hypothetical protein
VVDETLRLPYRVEAAGSSEAIEKAKATCRDEGWTIRTIASCLPASAGQWVVTIVVRSKVAA